MKTLRILCVLAFAVLTLTNASGQKISKEVYLQQQRGVRLDRNTKGGPVRINTSSLLCTIHDNYLDWIKYLRERPLREATGNALEITATLDEGNNPPTNYPIGKSSPYYFSFVQGTSYPCGITTQSTFTFNSTDPTRPTPITRQYQLIIDIVKNTIRVVSLDEGGRETFYQNCTRDGQSIIGVLGSKRIVVSIAKAEVVG